MRNRAVTSFIRHAKHFCALIENSQEISPREFAMRCAESLALLYSDGLQLPEVAPSTKAEIPNDAPLETKARLRRLIERKMGTYDIYWLVFDPFEHEEPLSTTLSDDILDIYKDIKDGLSAYERQGDSVADAVWHWKLSFDSHWGRHLVSALNPLHAVIPNYSTSSIFNEQGDNDLQESCASPSGTTE